MSSRRRAEAWSKAFGALPTILRRSCLSSGANCIAEASFSTAARTTSGSHRRRAEANSSAAAFLLTAASTTSLSSRSASEAKRSKSSPCLTACIITSRSARSPAVASSNTNLPASGLVMAFIATSLSSRNVLRKQNSPSAIHGPKIFRLPSLPASAARMAAFCGPRSLGRGGGSLCEAGFAE
eukprot:scaffold8608_cov220-Pinguiococcus_pyrenoidosus.AAC.1